jgi:hypothetical protein
MASLTRSVSLFQQSIKASAQEAANEKNNIRKDTISAMPAIENAMKTRYNRGNLEKGVAYIRVNQGVHTKVGKFQYSGYQGSGDGMELVMVFELDGKQYTLQEEMWGSVGGKELSYFEKDE